jgi:ABC-type dipeptide/oligopeptide/nickel transport system ATPase component
MSSSNDEELMTQSISEKPGVDICFHNLSLAVKVADKSINVVDNVTGRVQAKTMTALMGGSGAGELHNSLSIFHEVSKTQHVINLGM